MDCDSQSRDNHVIVSTSFLPSFFVPRDPPCPSFSSSTRYPVHHHQTHPISGRNVHLPCSDQNGGSVVSRTVLRHRLLRDHNCAHQPARSADVATTTADPCCAQDRGRAGRHLVRVLRGELLRGSTPLAPSISTLRNARGSGLTRLHGWRIARQRRRTLPTRAPA